MSSELPPGPGTPRLVNSFNWVQRPSTVMKEARQRYGEIWTLRLLADTNFVLVSDPQLVQGILGTDPSLLHAGEANAMIGPAMLGENSVLLLDDEPHVAKRRLLRPPFHQDHISGYRETIARICNEEIASWPLNEPIQLLPRMQSITLKAIMSVIFGVTGGEPQERLHARIGDVFAWAARPWHMAFLHLAHRRQSGLPKSFLAIRDPLDRVVFDEIERARQDPRLEARDDVLAMLLKTRYEDGSPMSDRDLRDQMITLLIQGHQSTAASLAWALERLMRHPESLERLHAEAQSNGEAFLDAVFKETLRVRPPIPIVMRRVVRQPYQLGPYELPVGSTIAPCIYMVHRHEEIYPEPERFRPERWLEQPELGDDAWIPFGGGDRHCVGRSFATAEFKEILGLIARQVRLAPAADEDERVVRRGILLAPNRGARAVIRERMAPVPAA